MNILEKIPFKKPKKEIVCVEIGMDWLKIAAASSVPGAKKLTKLNIKKVTSFKQSFSRSILDALAESGITTDTVLTYLPRHLTTMRILELPSVDKNEIADMVELQAAKQTPYSKEEIISNFKILGPADKEGYTKIMLVIVRKSIIEERLKLFQDAGLDVKFIGLSSEMIFRLYQYVLKFKQVPYKDAVIGLVDMDSNFTDFIFICRNNIVFTRSIFIGLENISAEPQVWKEKFIGQLKNSLDIYRQQGLCGDADKIIIGKSLEETADLSSVLKSILSIRVEVVDFMGTLSISEEVLMGASFHSKNISLLSCFGTLLSAEEPELNFLPRDMQMKRKLEKRTKELTLTGILLLTILTVFSAVFAEKIYNKTRLLNTLKQEVSRTAQESGAVEKMKFRIDIIRKHSDKKYSTLNCLRELYKVIPDEIYLSSLTYNNGKEIILAGTSDTMSSIFQFVNTVENLEYFEKVKTNYVTKKKKDGKETVDFEVVCAITR